MSKERLQLLTPSSRTFLDNKMLYRAQRTGTKCAYARISNVRGILNLLTPLFKIPKALSEAFFNRKYLILNSSSLVWVRRFPLSHSRKWNPITLYGTKHTSVNEPDISKNVFSWRYRNCAQPVCLHPQCWVGCRASSPSTIDGVHTKVNKWSGYSATIRLL